MDPYLQILFPATLVRSQLQTTVCLQVSMVRALSSLATLISDARVPFGRHEQHPAFEELADQLLRQIACHIIS